MRALDTGAHAKGKPQVRARNKFLTTVLSMLLLMSILPAQLMQVFADTDDPASIEAPESGDSQAGTPDNNSPPAAPDGPASSGPVTPPEGDGSQPPASGGELGDTPGGDPGATPGGDPGGDPDDPDDPANEPVIEPLLNEPAAALADQMAGPGIEGTTGIAPLADEPGEGEGDPEESDWASLDWTVALAAMGWSLPSGCQQLFWTDVSNNSHTRLDYAHMLVNGEMVTVYFMASSNQKMLIDLEYANHQGIKLADLYNDNDTNNLVKYCIWSVTLPISELHSSTLCVWVTQASPGQSIEGTFTITNVNFYDIEHYIYTDDPSAAELYYTADGVGIIGQTVTASPINIPGYAFDDGCSLNVSSGVLPASGTLTLKLYYKYDPSQVLPYTVEYYYNDLIDDSLTKNLSVHVLSPVVETVPQEPKVGYMLYPSAPYVPSLPATITADDNVIKVYYIIDPSNTRRVSYTVEYYLNDVLDSSLTQVVYEDIWINAPDTLTLQVGSINMIDAFGDGYACVGTTPSPLPETVNHQDVIKVYYEAIPYSVEYDLNYGSSGDLRFGQSQWYVGDEVTVIEDDPVRYGYVFTGWRSDYNDSIYQANSFFIMPATDVVLYAQWQPVSGIIVTFDAQGGSDPVPTSKLVAYGSPYGALATTSREGYTFAGWFTAPEGGEEVTSGSTVTVAVDHTLYARWTELPAPPEPITYTVTYAPGAYGTFAAQVTTGLLAGAATPAAPAVTGEVGWLFAGWAPAVSAIVTGNATYIAQWVPVMLTVTFVDWDGTVLGVEQVAYGGDATAPDDPEREGYTFTGWDSEYTNIIVDTTVTALYEPVGEDEDETEEAGPGGPALPGPATPPAGGPGTIISSPGDDIYEAEVAIKQDLPEALSEIQDAQVARAAGETGYWALLNLVMSVAGVLAAIIALVAYLAKRSEEDEAEPQSARDRGTQGQVVLLSASGSDEPEQDEVGTKRLWWRLVSAVLAVLAVILFVLTEDMRLPMQLVDFYTIYHAIILLAQAIVTIAFARRKQQDEERQDSGFSQMPAR